MKLRFARMTELKEISQLMLKEFSKRPFKDNAGLNAVVKSVEFYFKVGKILVAEECVSGNAAMNNARIKGVVVFKVEQYWEGPVIIIEDIVVLEKGKGVGSLLMKKVEEFGLAHKCVLITLNTYSKCPAREFYDKMGFRLRKEIVILDKRMNV
jgi:hypothetical protein